MKHTAETHIKHLSFIRFCCLSSVEEDVPEELEVEPLPEDRNEASLQNTEPNPVQETSTRNAEQRPFQDTSIQDLGCAKEQIPVLIPPPVEPEPFLLPAPVVGRDSVEFVGQVLQLETEGLELNYERLGRMKEQNEEEKEEEEEVQGEVEECAASNSVKEENIFRHQDGMSTQQVEYMDQLLFVECKVSNLLLFLLRIWFMCVFEL